MTAVFNNDYAERVYAGVLGKVIGVYLGRPFENWTYEMIQERLGDIENYVHEELGVPLIVTDDDISGTFTFLRALEDHNYNAEITAEQIGHSWLNYLIENRTILWWGGLGNSTEHTAYLRLKNGIEAPLSGSTEMNGQVVAEQIGAQIFIDGWAMISPGDPDQAVYFAEQAARVSHDGEAVNGAVVLAAMESLAFIESDINKLLDASLTYIPGNSVIRQLIDDIREWREQESDWRKTREWIERDYGYDKYGGNCHMVPNHGLIVHSLLHGNDDFSETMKIINTCGWDTDCNSGNVGCLMGIKNGIEGIETGSVDWRSPIADRVYIPTAEPTRSVSDCVTEADAIVTSAFKLAGKPIERAKQGAQFHFEQPGSLQGFLVTNGNGNIENVDGVSTTGTHALKLNATTNDVRFGTPVFAPSKDIAKYFENRGYALLASPRVYPGQVLAAGLLGSDKPTPASIYVGYYGENDQPTFVTSEATTVSGETTLCFEIPEEANPVFEIGVHLPDGGTVFLDSLSWQGEPSVTFTRPAHKGTMWRRAWVNGVDQYDPWWSEPFRLINNEGRGLLIQGTKDWRNYKVTADVTPHMVKASGIAARVQGMRRYYALILYKESPQIQSELRLVKVLNKEIVLTSQPFNWQLGETYELSLEVVDGSIQGIVNGEVVLKAMDEDLKDGGCALIVEQGRTATQAVHVSVC